MNTTQIKSEDLASYLATIKAPILQCADEMDDVTIASALCILQARLRTAGVTMTDPQAVKNYLTLRTAGLEHESFIALWLDAQNRLIEAEELFRGTLTQAAVYPREVVKSALRHNAAAVILSHNHPSGLAEPSRADKQITLTLKQALALVDVKLLDHVIIGGMSSFSFAEMGEI